MSQPTPQPATLAEPAVSGLVLTDAGPLAEADPQKVQQLVQQLEAGTLAAVHAFGRELSDKTAEQTDQLLALARSKDLDVVGAKLSEVVVAAKSLNLGPLAEGRSKVPLIGGLIDRFKVKTTAVAVKFQDVRTQIDTLLAQVQSMQGGLSQRVQTLEQTFEEVKQEHALLGAHVQAGEIATAKLGQRLAQMEAAGTTGDPLKAQQLQDLRAAVAALDKRIADLRLLQHAALQQLPMIRMVQANNRMLVEKFHNIRELTVPAWKRQFMLALSLAEQKSATELANTIDDATNEFMRENARLLKDNTIATAQANQRQVIDVETLQQVHDTLTSTVQEVVRINQEAAAKRSVVGAQLQALRQQMAQQIGHG